MQEFNPERNFPFLTGCILLVTLVVGCSGSQEESAGNQFFEQWKARVEESKAYSPPPKKHLHEPLQIEQPPGALTTDALKPEEKQLPSRIITMKISDIDVAVLLRALARVANQRDIVNSCV